MTDQWKAAQADAATKLASERGWLEFDLRAALEIMDKELARLNLV